MLFVAHSLYLGSETVSPKPEITLMAQSWRRFSYGWFLSLTMGILNICAKRKFFSLSAKNCGRI